MLSFNFSIAPNKTRSDRVLISTSVNTMEIYSLEYSAENPETFSKISTIDVGHTSGVRSMAVSSNDGMVCTTSSEQIKIWNINSRKCIRTMESSFGLCCLFVPGDKHVLVGSKEGDIELYDLALAEIVFSVKAHAGSVWCLDMRPDQRGFVSGGVGKEVKFWDFELVCKYF